MGLFNYLQKDIWRIRIEDLSKKRAFKIRVYRIFMLFIRGFSTKQIQQGASALTYYTLLSIVPILAMLFGITKGLFIQKGFEQWLNVRFADQQLVVSKLLEYAQLTLKQTDKGVLAGIGIAIVAWSAIRILIYTELVMNHIWEVKAKRTWAKKFTDYMAILGFCPVLLAISILITAYVSIVIGDIGKQEGILEDLGPVLFPILNFIPILVSWFFLTFLYIFMPNTYVRFRPAMYAAIITGTIYQIISWLYFYLQIGVSHYNAIYGTFAALPLFLVWVHLSWIIVLSGAKIAFAFQNVKAYGFISDVVEISHHMFVLIALRIAHLCVKLFVAQRQPFTALEISSELIIPLRLTNEALYRLVQAGVLIEVVQEGERVNAYAPALPEDQLTIKQVIDMLDRHGEVIPIVEAPEMEKIITSLEGFSDLMETSNYNLLLKEIK